MRCIAVAAEPGAELMSVAPASVPRLSADLISHVLPALLRRFHAAKAANAPRVVVWGTGAPRRR